MIVSYGVKITNDYSVFKDTIRIFRAAVKYIIPIALKHYKEFESLSDKERRRFIEILIHGTKTINPIYSFDKKFYKFPIYFRRSAISIAIGIVEKYIKEINRWTNKSKTYKKPHLNFNNAIMPIFFRNNTFKQNYNCFEVKVFKNNDWVYIPLKLRQTDLNYINKYDMSKASAPTLRQVNHRYILQFAFDVKSTNCFVKNYAVNKVIGVDLGIINDAVCSAVTKTGTVTGQTFINSPVEKDRLNHLLNNIKRSNHDGNLKCCKLWRWIKNYNKTIEINTARNIVQFALEQNAQVIVFEKLTSGKIKGSRAMRIHMWRKRAIQNRVKQMATRYGIRISFVCAWNTSKLAYDGSGEVFRHATNHSICRFKNDKVYNCDLSASKNIGARFFIRYFEKSIPEKLWSDYSAKVPNLSVRTMRTLSTLINLNAELAATYKSAGFFIKCLPDKTPTRLLCQTNV